MWNCGYFLVPKMPHANCIRDDKEGRINYKTGKEVYSRQYVCCVFVCSCLCVHVLKQIFIEELEKIKAVHH